MAPVTAPDLRFFSILKGQLVMSLVVAGRLSLHAAIAFTALVFWGVGSDLRIGLVVNDLSA